MTAAFIFSFVVITGASASVIRAAVMGGMLLLAGEVGRQYRPSGAIFFAALCMLVQNPKILLYDVGFQLSFLATMGIVYFMPLFERLTQNWPGLFGIKIIFFTTISAILATLPAILFHFGTLSLVAPIVNVLVLPVISLTMAFGFASIMPVIAAGTAFLTNLLLSYILWITHIFGSFSFASTEMPIPLWFFWVLMAALAGLYFIFYHMASLQPEQVDEDVRVW